MQRIGLGEGPDDGAKLQFDYAETDPSGRYGRLKEILGKGAMKRVYKAFDEVLGMEVAWNQVELNEVFRSPEELQRLYCEVHLLKNLNHDSIMRFHASWVDVQGRTFNFITEMFTSGTLREYRQKYKRLNIGAVKNWARQILRGLAYLHSHEPPVIHRDLKCDNIFVNGHLGQVKIGDLGLAAILQGSPHAHSVIGTPEFMAPEVYEEEYNELVDIYSFGMCVLEMLTSEYPYSECSNPAQIYKKVTSGKLPNAFYKIQNEEARQFVGKCLGNVSKRLPAEELLLDPFLALNERELLPNNPKNMHRALNTTNPPNNVLEDLLQPPPLIDPTRSTAMTITGTMNPAEDDTIFLRVQISEKLNGESRNIYFPFDVMNDTAGNVAMEMVKELEIKDWEPSEIALMIEKEISSLVPTWKEQDSFSYKEEAQHHPLCHLSLSSPSSSRASFPSPIRPAVDHVASNCYDWIQDTMFIDDDDATSRSSLNSYKYSSSNYCSGNDDDRYCDFEDSGPKTSGEPDHAIAKTHKTTTRFCPGDSSSTAANNYNKQRGNCGLQNHRRLTRRIQSLLDVRSQLLHRSLVEEIHKRRLYKTVGAVENIGFQEPTAGETSKGFGW